jgi:hypothetical protein
VSSRYAEDAGSLVIAYLGYSEAKSALISHRLCELHGFTLVLLKKSNPKEKPYKVSMLDLSLLHEVKKVVRPCLIEDLVAYGFWLRSMQDVVFK